MGLPGVKSNNFPGLPRYAVYMPSCLEAAFPIGGLVSWIVSTSRSPVPASMHLLALQLKPSWPVQVESAGASALHILPFGLNPGDARDRSLIGRGVLITPPFVGRLVGQ